MYDCILSSLILTPNTADLPRMRSERLVKAAFKEREFAALKHANGLLAVSPEVLAYLNNSGANRAGSTSLNLAL
jgi:hypothetical protein